MKEFLALLVALGCSPDAVIVIDPHMDIPAYYRDGVIYLRPDATRSQLVHECFHQRHRHSAKSEREHELNEREARLAELRERDD